MKVKITKDWQEALYSYEDYLKIKVPAEDMAPDGGVERTVTAIYGSDVPAEIKGSHELSSCTAYVMRKTLKGGYTFCHVTARAKTLADMEAGRKRFPREEDLCFEW